METLSKEAVNLRFGFYISVITAFFTFLTFGISVMTPPLSGPLCIENCFEYPFEGIVTRFPRDYYWMYPSMIVPVLFVMLMASVFHGMSGNRNIYGLISLCFAVIGAAILIPNYFSQLAVIQPSLLNNETEGIALFSQFNPHGMFIAYEEAGLLMQNISMFAMAAVFTSRQKYGRAVKTVYVAGFILAVISLSWVSFRYGIRREYIYEVIMISIVWLQIIISSVLLSLMFRKHIKHLSGQN